MVEDQPLRTKWGIIAKEKGDQGTPHLQGAIVIGKQVSFNTVKKWPGFTRCHIEEMKGTPHDSVVYCTKEDPKPFTWGELPEPGKRNDIAEACAALAAGASFVQLARTHGPAVVKFARGLATYKSLISPPRDVSEPPTVFWLYGHTGTGKTKCAWDYARTLFGDEGIWTSHDTLNWFDGYDDHPAVIIDDFRSKGISFSFLLRILDRYPLSVPFKGGFIKWKPKLIIVTTPDDICTTFSKRAEHIPEDLEQLARRITGRYYFPDDADTFMGFLVTEEPEPSHVSDSAELSESDVFGDNDDISAGDGSEHSLGLSSTDPLSISTEL